MTKLIESLRFAMAIMISLYADKGYRVASLPIVSAFAQVYVDIRYVAHFFWRHPSYRC